MIASRLNWTLAERTLTSQATKSVFVIKKANEVSGGLPPDMLKLVLLNLLYGYENCGLDVHSCIGIIHIWVLIFFRIILAALSFMNLLTNPALID